MENKIKLILVLAIGIILVLAGIVLFLPKSDPAIVNTRFVEGDYVNKYTPYYIGEDVHVLTSVKDYQVDKQGNLQLTYGIQVLDPQGKEIPSLSESKLFDVTQKANDEYHFTATISTLYLNQGEYTVITTVTDKIAKDSYTESSKLSIINPASVKLTGPFFKGFSSSDGILKYDLGSTMQISIQARGFQTQGTDANLDIIFVLLDNQGEIVPELSSTILELDKVNAPGQNVLSLPLSINTKDLEPGLYTVVFTADDKLAGNNHSVVRQVIIGG
ncbi:hypothetical protein HQ545_08970 [Candidatus Woesearchaeota archaeon]|nr:hypothetical protein [Candidatus Woesearchaeota archaeon]